MDKNKLLELLEETGVYQTGHFRLSSGRHAQHYLQCARLLQYPDKAAIALQELANQIPTPIDVVIGPALGGVIIAYELARALQTRAIFSERDSNNQMSLRRGFTLNPGEKVLVAEDVVTTGGSVREVLDLIADQGVELVGVAALIDRSNGTVDFGLPFYPLISLPVTSYAEENCPLCQAGIPIIKPGSRKL